MFNITYNDQVLNELFETDLNDDTLIIGTFAPWEIYNPTGRIEIDLGGQFMRFNVTENRRERLENSGVMIYFDITWDE